MCTRARSEARARCVTKAGARRKVRVMCVARALHAHEELGLGVGLRLGHFVWLKAGAM